MPPDRLAALPLKRPVEDVSDAAKSKSGFPGNVVKVVLFSR